MSYKLVGGQYISGLTFETSLNGEFTTFCAYLGLDKELFICGSNEDCKDRFRILTNRQHIMFGGVSEIERYISEEYKSSTQKQAKRKTRVKSA